MKTDRELLELSAKAAGIPIHIWGTKGSENCARMDCDVNQPWNPLTDDGDALRLAVRLIMELDICMSGAAVRTLLGDKILISSKDEPDRYAATRRAITRAAAAIGEAMQ